MALYIVKPSTLGDMVKYLEQAGFKAEKVYLSSIKQYKFTIVKDSNVISNYFTYPDVEGRAKEVIMSQFCDKLINDFYRGLKMVRPNNDCWSKENPDLTFTINTSWFTPGMEKVIFNDPATIVFWSDGTKTVVKTQNGEAFDPEKGLAMAIAKRAFGNQGNYFNHIRKWVDKYEADRIPSHFKTKKEAEELLVQMNRIIELYGHVTVADMLDLVGAIGSYVDNKYGWVNLKDAKIEEAFGGYILVLPQRYPLY